jgi:hypothetical protein
MGFYSVLIGFYREIMGFCRVLMGVYREIMGFYRVLMGKVVVSNDESLVIMDT